MVVVFRAEDRFFKARSGSGICGTRDLDEGKSITVTFFGKDVGIPVA